MCTSAPVCTSRVDQQQCVAAAAAKEELEPVGRVTVRGTGHRTVTSPYNNAIIIIVTIASP